MDNNTKKQPSRGEGLLKNGRLIPFDVLILLCLIFTLPSTAYTADIWETNDLDVKIGQMIMVGFRGLTIGPDSPITMDISQRHIGGVILFDYDVPAQSPVRNIQSSGQLKTLIVDLQRASPIPLLIAIDQEGGKVARLKETNGFPPSVSQQYLGFLDNPSVTRRYARQTAATLAEMGINLNLAPVVDLNVNPDNPVIGRIERSFSDRPDVVIRHATAMIDAFHEYGILSAIKHFPGHGSSTGDSHEGFVDVSATWTPRELIPFKVIAESGRCDMVMTAHIFNKTLDPRWPATLSSTTITGIMRNRFHYDGVIISDDMQMKAIRLSYDLKTAVTRALLAGIDILVFANNSVFEEDIAGRVISIIRTLVADGVIPGELIDRSYRRIVNLKKKLAAASSASR
jgi:beta-N-acetylhexosaminidase